MKSKIINFRLNHNILYILLNIILTGVGLFRAYFSLKLLSFNDLGTIGIIQTAVLLISFLQIGILNGGYRIFCMENIEKRNTINNLVFSFILTLFCFLVLFYPLLGLFVKENINVGLYFSTLIIGITSLLANWISNALIASSEIRELNILNIISNSFSLLILPSIYIIGYYSIILSLFLQPFSFIILGLVRKVNLRPTKFTLNLNLIYYVLTFGFIPFIAGIIGYLNIQIERWSIVSVLGTAQLGKYFLPMAFSNIFLLVPNSINNLFFPKGMQLFVKNLKSDFKSLLKKELLLLIVYILISSISVIIFLKQIVTILFPKHINSVDYVFIILPGLCFLVLTYPFSIIFNALVRLRYISYAYLSSIVFTLTFILIAIKNSSLSLSIIAFIDSFANLIILFVLILGYYKIKNELFEISPKN